MTTHAFPGIDNANDPRADGFLSYRGMTLRDYFIAHAPAEPQRWFEPVFEKRPIRPRVPDDLTSKEMYELDRYQDEEISFGELKEPRVIEMVLADEVLDKWERAYEKARCIQWPAAWADEMLKARDIAREEAK